MPAANKKVVIHNETNNVDLNLDATGDPQVDVKTMPVNTSTTGTVTANGGTVTVTLPNGCSTVALQITGTWVGQLEFEGSVDATNYSSIEASNGAANS
jgi:hypothetical protein